MISFLLDQHLNKIIKNNQLGSYYNYLTSFKGDILTQDIKYLDA